MKIEKLTENKIQIIIKKSEINDNCIDLHSIMTQAAQSQDFFLNILNKAEQEVGFNTDGCRLLIEAYSSSDESLVFTITKYIENNQKSLTKKRKVIVKKKTLSDSKNITLSFNSFDDFCEFCTSVQDLKITMRGLLTSNSLYLYNDIYYLSIKNLNEYSKNFKKFQTILSEFSFPISNTKNFESKLLEHGKLIIRKNAINTGVKYFGKTKNTQP